MHKSTLLLLLLFASQGTGATAFSKKLLPLTPFSAQDLSSDLSSSAAIPSIGDLQEDDGRNGEGEVEDDGDPDNLTERDDSEWNTGNLDN